MSGTVRPGEAGWLDAGGRPLFAVLHAPAEARGGVVLCPPMGHEAVSAHRTFRVLAESLCRAGWAAIRFDYDGTGDSAGTDADPDRLEAWTASVVTAAAALRQIGCPTVTAVGMRLGALLACRAAAAARFDAVVLWDPVGSGRSFTRELRALHLLSLGAPGEDGAEAGALDANGFRYTPETVAELSGAELVAPPAAAVLALIRADRPARRLEKTLQAWPEITVGEAVGQDLLLDRESSRAVVPAAAIDHITAWLADRGGAEAVPLRPEGVLSPTTEIDTPAGRVHEEVVSAGPLGLFAVVGTPSVPPPGWGSDGQPTIVGLNNAVDHHIGPSRAWVDWGRPLVARGWRFVRLDLTGIGDSPSKAGQRPDWPFPPGGVTDIVDAAKALGGDNVVFIGLCSGGRQALEAALAGRVRGAVALNAGLYAPRRLLNVLGPDQPYPAALKRLESNRVLGRLNRAVPSPVWRTLHAFGRGPEGARLLLDLDAAGVDTQLVYGTGAFELWKTRERSRWAIDRLTRKKRLLTISEVDDLDHAGMRLEARRAALAAVATHLTRHFGALGRTAEELVTPTAGRSATTLPAAG